MPTGGDLALVHQDGAFRIGTYGSTLIIRFEGAPGPEQLERVYATQQELVKATGNKVALISVIFPASLSFDDEARKKSAVLVEKMGADIIASAQIVTKTGFFASIVRSVMVGVKTVSKPAYPTKICSTVDAGADFVCGYLADADTPMLPDELIRAIDQVIDLEFVPTPESNS